MNPDLRGGFLERVPDRLTRPNDQLGVDLVPAGEWTLHVLLPGAATEYRFDPAEVRLTLEPGDREQVAVRLVPIVRRIQFMDGGTLKSE